MGLMIVFVLVTILSGLGTLSALKNKNFLGFGFGAVTLLVFGWFTVMTILDSGYPA